MAHKYRLDFDGQSVVQDDYNGLANEASTAEDHVYAELFRLTPGVGTIARGLIPYGTGSTIVANGASGSVLVNPFRAVIGTRTSAATDAVENWQDVRSSLSIADGATSLTTLISFAANESGNPRWDAVYAAVTVDAVSVPTTRKVKNPGTGVVTDESVSVYSRTAVAISSVAGTPAATPTFPTIPSDAGDVYYILLGYVRIPTGFNSTSTVSKRDINESTKILAQKPSSGVATLQPANQNNIDGGTAISGTGTPSGTSEKYTWTGTASRRPAMYIPPSMQGVESLIVTIDVGDTSSTNWSHQDGDIIDNSRDWRNRICKWGAMVMRYSSSQIYLPWESSGGVGFFAFGANVAGFTPGYGYSSGASVPAWTNGMGSTFPNGNPVGSDYACLIGAAGVASNIPAAGSNVCTTIMVANSILGIYCDQSTGALKMKTSGGARVRAFFWIDFTAKYPSV